MNLRFEEETKKERRIQLLKETIWFLAAAVLVVLLAWLIVRFALKKVSVIGSAMETTLYNGEDVIVNKTSYLLLSPGRGAVVAFYPEQKEGEEMPLDDSSVIIRRIVGLPGETVQIKDGQIYINDEEIEESYDFPDMLSSGLANDKIKLEGDEYFVLSDNRADMDDSRNSSFTKVKRGNLIGKVILTLSPISLIGGPEQEKKEQKDETETKQEAK
ncbi:MAG: signal peptidase I [Lachnospiraceae bacterium]|nr:signal peptidase I [Lachnospiraceae bacterium]